MKIKPIHSILTKKSSSSKKLTNFKTFVKSYSTRRARLGPGYQTILTLEFIKLFNAYRFFSNIIQADLLTSLDDDSM